MAKNREMLKEAIAEAKAVKEMAIANAKAALEEAFTPQLKSMLSLKLQEMEIEEAKDVEETNEAEYTEMEEVKKDTMEVDLEELLAELELEEDDDVEENLYEAEEEGEKEGEEEEGEEGDMEMEDLSDDEIKEMIEDVIAQMIKDGELEAGPEFEGEEEGEEMEMGAEEEEEVDLAELLREIEEMEEEVYEKKEETNEVFGFFKINNLLNYLIDEKKVDKKVAKNIVNNLDKNPNNAEAREDLKKYITKEDIKDFLNYTTNDTRGPKNPLVGAPLKDLQNIVTTALNGTPYSPVPTTFGPDGRGGIDMSTNESEEIKKELEEAYSTIETLKTEINEINLLNAKLLYSNKIFKAKNLNENQKVKVLSSFDKAKNVGEVKMVYETLNEGIKVKKEIIKENLGRASKSTVTPTAKQPIVESNDVFKRMQKLAGLI